jgi:hypothetical protein
VTGQRPPDRIGFGWISHFDFHRLPQSRAIFGVWRE